MIQRYYYIARHGSSDQHTIINVEPIVGVASDVLRNENIMVFFVHPVTLDTIELLCYWHPPTLTFIEKESVRVYLRAIIVKSMAEIGVDAVLENNDLV